MGTSWGCGVRACGGWSPTSTTSGRTGWSSGVMTRCCGGDRQWLVEITRELGCRDTVRYEYARAAEGLLLSVPDATAWWWGRGGDWRRRIRPGHRR